MRLLFVWIGFVFMASACVYAPEKLSGIEKANKLLWVFVKMDNCPWCEKMEKEIIESGFYKRRLSEIYTLEILSKDEAKECGLNVKFFPTSFLVYPGSGKLLDELHGYMRPADFLEFLKIVHEQSGLPD